MFPMPDQSSVSPADKLPNNTQRFLQNRHVIVTGGSRGIGAAVGEALARLGAQVTLMARTERDIVATAARLTERFGVKAQGIVCDVQNPESIADAFGTARESFGEPYVLVNNAGRGTSSSFASASLTLWETTLAINLTSVFLCTQQVLPAMLAVGEGRIINIASTAGLKGYSYTAAYCAAKHGVIGMTRSLAVEVAKRGITVNAVCPGYTDTDMTRITIEELAEARQISEENALAMLTRNTPTGRLTQPDEVANAVAWLCSPHATAITGQAIAVAGGEVM
jgi:NAD(P)-dependent dehydrogenase (short-subunit alcohol dehydrogenase family)